MGYRTHAAWNRFQSCGAGKPAGRTVEACSSGRGQAGVLLAAAVLVIGLLMPVGNHAQAQQAATITGTVTNEATGATLPGVNVVIEGSTQGAATGPKGEYTITGVEPGTYTLIASFAGTGTRRRKGCRSPPARRRPWTSPCSKR